MGRPDIAGVSCIQGPLTTRQGNGPSPDDPDAPQACRCPPPGGGKVWARTTCFLNRRNRWDRRRPGLSLVLLGPGGGSSPIRAWTPAWGHGGACDGPTGEPMLAAQAHPRGLPSGPHSAQPASCPVSACAPCQAPGWSRCPRDSLHQGSHCHTPPPPPRESRISTRQPAFRPLGFRSTEGQGRVTLASPRPLSPPGHAPSFGPQSTSTHPRNPPLHDCAQGSVKLKQLETSITGLMTNPSPSLGSRRDQLEPPQTCSGFHFQPHTRDTCLSFGWRLSAAEEPWDTPPSRLGARVEQCRGQAWTVGRTHRPPRAPAPQGV